MKAWSQFAGRSPLKICFSVSRFPLPSQTFVITQVLYALREGHDVTVACGSFETDTVLSQETSEAMSNVRIVNWPPAKPSALRLLPIGVFDRIVARWDRSAWRNKIDADVIIAHFGFRGAAAVRAQKGWNSAIPLVTLFHGRDVSVEYKRNRMAKFQDLFAVGDLHLTVNKPFAEKLVASGAPSDRVHTHHLGVPVSRYEFSPKPQGTPLRFISISRLVEKKGLHIAIEALRMFHEMRQDTDWQYDIVGDGPMEADLSKQVEDAGLRDRIHFLGSLPHDDVLRRVAEADALILPSITAADGDQEGIPVTLMEAMGVGTPVCTTRHSGIPELVTHGVSGLLSEEGDAEGLCENLVLLTSEPERVAAITVAAREKVEREFNEDRQNAVLLERCQELVEKHRQAS